MSYGTDLRNLSILASAGKAASAGEIPQKAHYSPPWADMSIIGIAGSSGSGKTSLAVEIVQSLNLPWVIILSIDSFYKSLTPGQNAMAHRNEYDLDSPESIDFDLLVEKLIDLKQGKRTDIPIYSFQQHQRLDKTVSIYSPHVVLLEGILALHDPRVLDLLDMKIFVEADPDVCLSRRIVRDVRERGRTIEGVIKQWFRYVKPVFQKYVDPQREIADVIVPRGMQNKMAIQMIVNQTRQILKEKSIRHNAELEKLGQHSEDYTFSENVMVLGETPQVVGVSTILRNPITDQVDFVFYFDRLTALLIEKALDCHHYVAMNIITATGCKYSGLKSAGIVSAVVILRGGSCMETGLKRTIPDCLTGRLLIQSNMRTGEPELHYLKLFPDLAEHETIMLLDPQMSSGGAALMAVKVLVDHGAAEEKIVFVTCLAGRRGLKRLMTVFPKIKVVVARIVEDNEKRWMEERYFGC
ncbi:uridine kinase [Cladophialophora psammophila CBS 110553]|uniref:Uridine kinase n=1 Tax=Cladophialophora psammophila CBS 110553 TaxID=1182543 RepID=W9X470_9EURO|nr:uridine kinase [Cladophialophora psammophila CBS 110553]EXJ75282.1 uridine kinase [Cladophialophora psammophila CBS 110553]